MPTPLDVPVTTLEATSPPGESASAAELLPTVTSDEDRLTVALTVAGHGPFRFLVDTGSDRTAVSRQLAASSGSYLSARRGCTA